MKSKRSRRQLTLLTIMVIVLLISLCVLQSAAQLTVQHAEHVCKDIDVRNSVENFKKNLENCTVIEGYLRILLIDRAQPSDYANLTFPKLREITDYFLLFRVSGLKTLRHLFPNLAVIRGSNLFHNYAFVVFEMLDLQEIGLPKFTDVIRGAVRIEKNPKLCYLDTIDWDDIARGDHFIKANSGENECPNRCPEKSGRQCPQSKKTAKKNALLCWSDHDCQKVCNDSCGRSSCREDLESCCHPECIGGCTGTSQADCSVCRNVLFQGKCTKSCPDNTYLYMKRRCLTDVECIRIQEKIPSEQKTIYFKAYNGVCRSSCPDNFTEDSNNASFCVPCKESCPKECPGRQITNIAEAQLLSGCTKINGFLDIQITGGKNVVKELETHLDKIKEITEYLKVVRNVPLMSLNFLKSLEVIGGVKKYSELYALYVLDNPNLEYLWDWNNHKAGLKIKNGKVFFHYNPKLCLEKIVELENKTNAQKSDEKDVSPQSNGNRIACKVRDLNISVVRATESRVIIKWSNFLGHIPDHRSLLGYLISYKEAPFENVTLFDDHDACSTESWKVMDVPIENYEYKELDEENFIANLKPFTKYAVYVKTYTVATELNGGQSSIIYFSTKPTKPSTPVDVKVFSKSPHELIVSWKPPRYPNGLITHYILKVTLKADNQEFLDLRNYCTEPLSKVDLPVSKQFIDPNALQNVGSTTSPPSDGKCCACPKDKKQQAEEDAERQFQIQFENFLHNTVYIKRPDANPNEIEHFITSDSMSEHRMKRDTSILEKEEFAYRIRRDLHESLYSEEANQGVRSKPERKSQPNALPNLNTPVVKINATANVSKNDSFERRIPSNNFTQLNTTIDKLKHFSEYSIKVIACQDDKNNPEACSGEAIVNARTQHSKFVDDIDTASIITTVSNKTSNAVNIRWKSPSNPNGLILNFHIELRKQEIGSESMNVNPLCITHKTYLLMNGYNLQGLLPGNYSLRLLATSLAGPSQWTPAVYFNIPEPTSYLSVGAIIGIVIGSVVGIVGFIIAGYFIHKEFFKKKLPDIMYASVNPEYLSNMYVPDEWEIPREKITMMKELGNGSFGMVYEGKAKDIIPNISVVSCAIKTVNETATLHERIEFLNEASVMKAFSSFHVVKLFGVVSKGQPTLVIMELMAKGDLKTYLRLHRPDNEDNDGRQPPTLQRMLQMAVEIADGMAYLAEKKFVHRDLAARNCMVSENLTVKIGDFGMTRDIYETDYYRKGGKGLLPVRWMAPESLKDGVFTSQSDVWSYGIVLWEMATLASQPYQGLANDQVLKYVMEGGIMEEPENCPEKLYDLMRRCFHYNPKFRPTFIQIIESLLPDANVTFSQVSFYHNGHNGGGYDPCVDQMDNSVIDEEEASPSTPLRSPQSQQPREEANCYDDETEDNHNKSSSYTKHFRLHKPPNKHHHHHHRHHNRHQTPPAPHTSLTVGGVSTSENGRQGVSNNSSDGSKASACSANGSVLNGHAGVPLSINRTAEC